jgi:hypothetical protein
VSHGRPKTIFGQRKIFQSAPHKNSGGVNRAVQRGFAIDQQHSEAAFRQQARTLQTCQAGTDYYDVIAFHCSDLKPRFLMKQLFG